MKEIYSIKDTKVSGFLTPFFVNNETEAVRSIKVAVQDSHLQLCIFSEDYDLFKIGEFDEISGQITTCQPMFIVGCSKLKKEMRKNVNDQD
nr:MAG: nonstructural protein [Microviridae sp.]